MHSSNDTRCAGALCLAGAGATAVAAVAVQAFVVPSTDVSDKVWSYPWSPGALVPVSLAYIVLHLVVLAGLRGVLRSGVTGPGRAARIGGRLLLAGTALLAVGEVASIPIRSDSVDSTRAGVVGAAFGVAILLTLVGLFMLAATTAKAWHGWRRWSPLAAGICTLPLVGLSSSHYLPTGVALYGLGLALIGLALATDVARATSPAAVARALPA